MWFCHSASPYGWRVGKSLMSSRIWENPATCAIWPLRQEPIGDSALVEHLDGAGM